MKLKVIVQFKSLKWLHFSEASSNRHQVILICDKLCSSGVFGAIELAPKSVIEGESVTLYTYFTQIQQDDWIQWWFGKYVIVDTNVTTSSMTVYDDVLDGRFKDRLKLDNQTGYLTITNITTEHAGDYTVSTNKPMMTTFSVIVYGELHLFHLLTF